MTVKKKKTAAKRQKRGKGGSQPNATHRAGGRPFEVGDSRIGPGDPFKPGYDPRRAGNGNRNPAWSVLRWAEELCSILPDGSMKYPPGDLTQIVADASGVEEHPKVIAAGMLLRARRGAADGDYSKAGIPLAANDLDRILDRFIGKPVQSHVIAHAEIEPADVLEQIEALCTACPALRGHLAGLLGVTPPALPAVDGTATPIEVAKDGPGPTPATGPSLFAPEKTT